MTESRPPFPPFDLDSALARVQAAEDAWNTRDPQRVSLAYTDDSIWRNRDVFLAGRPAIIEFRTAKWERELDYVLRKNLWAFGTTVSRPSAATSALDPRTSAASRRHATASEATAPNESPTRTYAGRSATCPAMPAQPMPGPVT